MCNFIKPFTKHIKIESTNKVTTTPISQLCEIFKTEFYGF